MPAREIATVRSLERDSQACNIARAGDNVTVNLQGIEANRVTAGGMICHPDYPVQVANRLELKILVLDIPTPILIGSQVTLTDTNSFSSVFSVLFLHSNTTSISALAV